MLCEKLNKKEKKTNNQTFKRQIRTNIPNCSIEQQKINKLANYEQNVFVNSGNRRNKPSSCDFVKCLISKIKSVERIKAKSYEKTELKVRKKLYTERGIKSVDYREQTKKKNHKSFHIENIIQQIENTKKRTPYKSFEENRYFQQQFLRLGQENKDLKQKIRHLTSVIQSYNSSINHKQSQLSKKDGLIAELKYLMKEKENCFQSQIRQITAKIALLEKENQKLKTLISKNNICNHKQANSTIEKTISEFIFPTGRSTQQKAQKQLNQIKIDMVSLKKQFESSYNQLKQSKDKQIEDVRQSFLNNLNNFKAIILKCTSNSIQLANTLLEKNLPESKIIEISSDQSADSS